MAVVAAVVYRVMDIAGIGGFTLQIFDSIVFFNLLLAIFNLIPIPPLDGYNASSRSFRRGTALVVQRYAQYGIILLLLLVFLPNSPLGCCLALARPLTEALIGA